MENKAYKSWERNWDIQRINHSDSFLKFFDSSFSIVQTYIFLRDRIYEFTISQPIELKLIPGNTIVITEELPNFKRDSILVLQHSIFLKLFAVFNYWLNEITYRLVKSNVTCYFPKFFGAKSMKGPKNFKLTEEMDKKIKDKIRAIGVIGIVNCYQSLGHINFEDNRHSIETIVMIRDIRHDLSHGIGNKLEEHLSEEKLNYPNLDIFDIYDLFFHKHFNALIRCAKDIDKSVKARQN